MAVLFDYLDWRGDLSFASDPANEADYYLISKIGCPNLTAIVPSDGREIPLKPYGFLWALVSQNRIK